MGFVENLALVFVAGLFTAFATGLGAVPFFFVDDFGDRWNVVLWGLASGIMVSASLFGLVNEGLAYADGFPTLMVLGLLAGVVLVEAADWALDAVDIGDGSDGEAAEGGHGHDHAHDDSGGHDHAEHAVEAEAFAEGDLRKLVLILGILTVHSFPEGVAVGVSFAELGFEGGVPILGFSVPLLAVFMTVAISIHNVPEGVAVSIPMQTMNVSRWRMVGAAVFSSLPQPIGAVIAFAFVRWAQAFLPFGFGFAAGAMVYLVLTEFVPEALETGEHLPNGGHLELVAGLAVGVAAMVPLMYV
ncbi:MULTISPECIES: ZIP family metal transporter [Halorussus]|uniref:ZIP family metal transporter n=1 Tax=Halorussus TaxID=1070314 RepID=UPI00209D5B34|nr:ZIP family metal transporter [Halorussus vallis]USZ77242.1 ZIP family metal transporter [Halorussus vallis]